jgi:hypothetical protein
MSGAGERAEVEGAMGGVSNGSRLEHFVSITQDDLDDLMVEAVKPWGTKVAAVRGTLISH